MQGAGKLIINLFGINLQFAIVFMPLNQEQSNHTIFIYDAKENDLIVLFYSVKEGSHSNSSTKKQ